MLATDTSERSDRALRRAALIARQSGAPLSFVHVVDDDQPRRIVDSGRDAASAVLPKLRSTVQGVDAVSRETRVVPADPCAGFARAAEEETPDLLVTGPHRRPALRAVFVGTAAERTIRSVTCPVLMVPVLMVKAPPVGSCGQVMLTTDMSEGAERAAKVCRAPGISRGAKVSVLHVFDAPALRLGMSDDPIDGLSERRLPARSTRPRRSQESSLSASSSFRR